VDLTPVTDVLTAIKGDGWSDETLVAIQAAIEAIDTGSGTGATTVEYTLTEADSGEALIGAVVQLYTDEDRTVEGPVATTNTLGVATFGLDAGTYYPTITYQGAQATASSFTVT
jgi:hypothetical protein